MGRRINLSLANGTSTSYNYDDGGRLLRLKTEDPTLQILQDHQYTHDNVGNRLTHARTLPFSQDDLTYTYDPTYQLLSAQGSELSAQYSYDRLDNRLSSTANGTPTTYLPNPLNQYTQVGPVYPTYDSNGNLTYDGTQSYTYDPENRLLSATDGATTSQYTYDYAGRRISSTHPPSLTTHYLYDGDQLLAEYDGFGTLQAKYVYGIGIDEPLVMLTPTAKYFYHQDGLGSITAITDTLGNLVEQYDYDPYGNPTIKDATGTVIPESTIGNRFMFTGREWDSETGLYHYRNRTYSPTLGRFLQTDKVGYRFDLNLYRYVYNSPLNWVDPYGLFTQFAPGNRGDFPGGKYVPYHPIQIEDPGRVDLPVPPDVRDRVGSAGPSDPRPRRHPHEDFQTPLDEY